MSRLFRPRRFRRQPGGGYSLRLAPSERALLASLPAQVEELLDQPTPPPHLERLFPPAYPDDPDAERGYRDLMQAELLEHHRAALRTLADSVQKQSLTGEEAAGWMAATNDVRLMLGTALDVTDDWEPPDDLQNQQAFVLYAYLTELLGELIEEMSAGLPDPLEDDEEFLADPWGDPPQGMRWAPPGAPPVSDATRAPGFVEPEEGEEDWDDGEGGEGGGGGDGEEGLS